MIVQALSIATELASKSCNHNRYGQMEDMLWYTTVMFVSSLKCVAQAAKLGQDL